MRLRFYKKLFMVRKSKENKRDVLQSPGEAIVKTSETKGIYNNSYIHALTIIFITFLTYSNTFNAPFVFDDTTNIVENHRIKDISNIPSFFTNIMGLPIMARPLTAATFAINYYLGGLNTTGYHIVSLLLHIANGLLLYFLIKITAGYLKYPDEKKTGLIALFSALLFTAHPIQTESVTYIVTRSALLSTFFFFLGIILFTRAAGTEGRKRILYTTLLFITSLLGMASREEFFLFPLMLILYDLYFVSKREFKTVLRHWNIHLPVITTLGYVFYIVMTFDYGTHAGFGVKAITPFDYLMTQFNVHWTYIRLLLLPINQNLDYDYPIAKTLFELPTIFSFIGYVGIWGAGIYLYRKKPVISFCLLWFMITLFPSSSFMPIIDVIFEHRVYLPSVGFFIAVLVAIEGGLARWGDRLAYSKKAIVSVMITVMLALSVATYARNTLWKDKVALWEDVLRSSPDKSRPHNYLGLAYTDQGRIDEAINEYQTAIKLNPYDYMAASNLGNAYFNQRRVDEAFNEYQSAIKLRPDYVKAHYNLGVAYESQNRIDEAISAYQTALSYDPGHVNAHNNLGIVYIRQGRVAAAINEFQFAVRLNPDFLEGHYNLGLAYTDQGRIDEAINAYQTVLRLRPGLAQARENLELLLKNRMPSW